MQMQHVQRVYLADEDAGELGWLLTAPDEVNVLVPGESEELAESSFSISAANGSSFVNEEHEVRTNMQQHMAQSIKL